MSDPWHYPRPQLAAEYLDRFDTGLIAARALYASRRRGKSTFLVEDLKPAAASRRYLVIYCNLWASRHDAALELRDAIQSALEPPGVLNRLRRAAQTPVKKLKISGKSPVLGEASAELDLDNRKPNDTTAIREISKGLEQLNAGKRRVLLLIDEAQILADSRHEALASALRASLDTKKDRIKVIFTGSSEDALRRMFGDQSLPFYRWAAIEPFPLLGEDFVGHLVATFAVISKFSLPIDAALQAYRVLGEVPEYMRLFLDKLAANPFQEVSGALASTQKQIVMDAGYPERWRAMTPTDRALLVLIASGGQDLHGVEARREIARLTSRTAKEVAPTTVANSLRRLLLQDLIARTGHGQYRIADDIFREWIRTGRD